MPTVAERVSVLETKIENFDEKLDDVKNDITSNHSDLKTQLKTMYDASCQQHAELAGKIKDLEGIKDRWIKWTMIVLAFAAGAGWIGNANLPTILKFIGL